MPRLTFSTAGESHGACLVTLIEGLPAGLDVPFERANDMLRRRQGGYGRGGRQKIERDEIEILSGVLRGRTIGSPLALRIPNRDHRIDEAPPLHRPRPGHADLAGAVKWETDDCRPVLERASARETAARTAAGAFGAALLTEFGIEVAGFVTELGDVASEVDSDLPLAELVARRDASDVYCPDPRAEDAMKAAVDAARRDGDTLGGIFEVRATGLPIGLGSCFRREDRLDARLAAAIVGIQAVKGVEIGHAFDVARRRGSAAHDEILPGEGSRFRRASNHAGGLEGGMTNGETLIVRAAKKPISTLGRRLRSVDLRTGDAEDAAYERSDICALPAASVIGEAVVAFELAAAFLETFGADTLAETRRRFEAGR
ncbi:MAG: chorismate synthase [bacterium]